MLAAFTLSLAAAHASAATTPLADGPISGQSVSTTTGNLALDLSISGLWMGFPIYPNWTMPGRGGLGRDGNYYDEKDYMGYFDPKKCYTYVNNTASPDQSYFQPAGLASGSNGHFCTGKWSGNYLNWGTMTTADEFRSVMTGGYRAVDTTSETILERANMAAGIASSTAIIGGAGQMWFAAGATVTQAALIIGPGNISYIDFSMPISSLTPFSGSSSNSYLVGLASLAIGNETKGPYGTAITFTALPASPNLSNPGIAQYQGDGAETGYSYGIYVMNVRVKVCDPSPSAGGLEANCVSYGDHYKPEGLLQKYASKLRYNVFGYTLGSPQQGGVMRSRMGFIGPTNPATNAANPLAEWDPSTGILTANPNSDLAASSSTKAASIAAAGVGVSGSINYINQFGLVGGGAPPGNGYTYPNLPHYSPWFDGAHYTVDNAGSPYNYDYAWGDVWSALNQAGDANENFNELYYASLRYFENMGNVPEWNPADSGIAGVSIAQFPFGTIDHMFTFSGAAFLDGFPTAKDWGDDPIGAGGACQNNYILGVAGTGLSEGGTNVGGGTIPYTVSGPRPMPAAVAADTFNKAQNWAVAVEKAENYPPYRRNGYSDSTINSTGGVTANGVLTDYLAGLAYGAHVLDIRPDLPGKQTVKSFFVDLGQSQNPNWGPAYVGKNGSGGYGLWLAAKYGGFDVPADYAMGTSLTVDQWSKSGRSSPDIGIGTPDNYFPAYAPEDLVAGLTTVFNAIASAPAQYSSTLAPASVNVGAGVANYSVQYDPATWSSTITASNLTALNPPVSTSAWSTDATLSTQFTGTGWDTGRRVVTWNGSAGVPFRLGSLTPAQKTALSTPYRAGDYAQDYLNYLRGDRSQEQGSTATGSSDAYRLRGPLLGDIVNAKLTPVGPPSALYSSGNNPGYDAFKSANSSRPIMVLAAANDGMLHVINGALSGASAGSEIMAYVPSPTFTGPDSSPTTDGLAALGSPTYVHHFYVDATPQAFDVDFRRAGTAATPATTDWHTIAVGGMGKGGKSFYGIDVTDPSTITNETAAAGKVLWEFTDSTMGFSYGMPTMVKTRQYGWTLILTSGYNNSDGYGYLYLVNPQTGVLLQKIRTPQAAPGLAQASAYIADYTNGTADAVYAGDLNGQLWRFDITATSGDYPAPALLLTARDSSGAAQPITSAPLSEVDPGTQKRYILFGTGQLLDDSDLTQTGMQSFYAIVDGTSSAFDSSVNNLARADLVAVSNLLSPPTMPANSKGWYADVSNGGWRMVQTAVSYSGNVAFTAIDPQAPNAAAGVCVAATASRVYEISFGTGGSALSQDNGSGGQDAYQSFTSQITDLVFMSSGGRVSLMGGGGSASSTGTIVHIHDEGGASSAPKLYNWREVPVVE